MIQVHVNVSGATKTAKNGEKTPNSAESGEKLMKNHWGFPMATSKKLIIP